MNARTTCQRPLDALWPDLQAAGADGDVVHTTAVGHAAQLARKAVADGVSRLVIVGGDGTGFEVLNGLFPVADGSLPEVAYLPLGTGNSFVRDLHIDDTEAAVRALAQGRAEPVDVLHARCSAADAHSNEASDFYSINLISTGFTADVGDVVNRRFKRLGAAGYAAGVLARLATLKSPILPIQLDDATVVRHPITLLSLSNSRYTGGSMEMAPDARIDDGLMDVIRVGRMGRFRLITAFPRIYAGTHTRMAAIETHTARAVTFPDAAPRDWMVDGEVLHRTVESVAVLPGALRVVR